MTTCKKHTCIFCINGECILLTDTDFGKRSCPFFKEKKDVKKDTNNKLKEDDIDE